MQAVSKASRRGLVAGMAALALFASQVPVWAVESPWLAFESGRTAFEERRLGEALNSWRAAIELRQNLLAKAAENIGAAISSEEGREAKNSIRALMAAYARSEISSRDRAALESTAQGSLRRLAELYKARNPGKSFYGFLDGLLTVMDTRAGPVFGDSLSKLVEAAQALEGYPEAEFGIGRIFLAEGELSLAESQFRKALALSAALEVPDQRFEILEALAAVYRAGDRWKDYEATLLASLEDAQVFSEKNAFLRQAMERALALEGFDSFMGAYRIDEPRIARPSAELGEFLLRNGRSRAVIHLAVAANIVLTRIIGEIKREEPGFQYVDLGGIFAKMRRRDELRAYAEGEGLWKTLYYLGEALVEEANRESARKVFTALALSPDAGPWSSAASLALKRPRDAAFILP